MKIKSHVTLFLVGVLISCLQPTAAVAQGAAFTYQGQLQAGEGPASGLHDLQFNLFDSDRGGRPRAEPQTLMEVAISNGLFTVTLDFGPEAFFNKEHWLEIGVRGSGAGEGFEILSPRQPVTPAPTAIFAGRAGSYFGPVTAGQLPSNVAWLDTPQNFSASMTLLNPGNQIGGDGSSLSNLSLAAVGVPGTFDDLTTLEMTNGVQYPSSGTVPAAIAAADLNGDGRNDLAVANRGTGTVTILTNSGLGFVLAWTIVSRVGAAWVTLVDIDRDGMLDVLCASQPAIFGPSGDNSITVARGLGNASFAAATFHNSTPALTTLAVGDLNGDNWPDLVAGARNTNVVSIFLNDGAGGFPAIPTSHLTTAANPNAVALAELTGDARVDLVTAHGADTTSTHTNVAVYPGSGTGGFNTPTTFLTGNGFKTLAVADINRDGLKDIVVGMGQSGARIDVFTNSGPGGFTLHQTLPATYIGSLTVDDFNRDGWPDVAVTDGGFFGYTGMRMMLSDGRGRLEQRAHLTPFAYASASAGDLDGDGQAELIAPGGSDSGVVAVFQFNVKKQPGLAVYGPTELRGPVSFEQRASFEAGLNASGQASFNGSAAFSSDVSIGGTLSFGGITRQMLNLWGTIYGLGVQNNTLYFRSGLNDGQHGFAWYAGGTHSNNPQDPGAGGASLMTLHPLRLMVTTPSLHLYSASSPATLRVQSAGGFGAGRLEFWSDPVGSGSEWRPGYIQSSDNGGFTGGLSFVVNGTGFDNRLGEIETMRIVNGRVGIRTSAPATYLQVVNATCDGASWINSSDRYVKRDFANVDPREVLEKVAGLSIQTWSYTNDSRGTRHIGPMAQDFHAAFGLGTDDKHIATVDADGVALVAIQGLNEKVETGRQHSEGRMQKLEAENAELKQRLEALEKIIRQQPSN